MTTDAVRWLRGTHAGPSDEQLLLAHRTGADPAALDALARRHAPMVWAVCRRVAGNTPDAEDAFQATFLVFVRRAASIADPRRLGSWLHGVARRTAHKARTATARCRAREGGELVEPPAPPPGPWADALPILDAELARLPEHYRTALVLCDLRDLTRREAAELLGVPPGTLAARVARGRALLAARLARRGVQVPAAAVAGLLAPAAEARGPVRLLTTPARPPAAALADEVLTAMLRPRLAAGLVALAAGLALTAAAVATQPPATQPPAPSPAGAPAPGWREAYTLRFDHPVAALACSADRLAAGDDAGNLDLCDPLTGKARVRKLTGAPPDTPNALRGYDRLAFTADGSLLFSIREERSAVWFTRPADRDAKAWGVGGGTHILDLSADAKAWVEANGDGVVVRPNVYLRGDGDEALVPDYESSRRYDTGAAAAALSPDGKRLAVLTKWLSSTGRGGELHVHDRAARDGTRLGAAAATAPVGKQRVTALEFSADGSKLAAVGDAGFARVFDAGTGKELAAPKGHGGIVFCAAFSPDGAALATGGDDGVVRVWDAATGRLRAELKGHTDSVRAVRFEPAGRRLFTASADRTVRAWVPPR